jgi:hypothetical protein
MHAHSPASSGMEKGKRTAAATGHGAAVVGGEPEGDEGSTAHAPAGCQQRQLGCVAPGQTPAERGRGHVALLPPYPAGRVVAAALSGGARRAFDPRLHGGQE